jgi:L-threonylcarbamoyladenylate synthase
MKTEITTKAEHAVQALLAGEVVAIPTETVYGLAGAINSNAAIEKIFKIKNRPATNPLIVHISKHEDIDLVATEIPQAALKLAEALWPGPLTLVLKKQPGISDLITAGSNTVAVRMPKHPLTLSLLQHLEIPIAAPSANPFGRVSPTMAGHVFDYFNGTIPLILDGGACNIGIESTIVGFEDGEAVLYRYGTIIPEEIEKVIGNIHVNTQVKDTPKAPGMFLKHYSPRTPLIFTDDVETVIKYHSGKRVGVLSYNKPLTWGAAAFEIVLSEKGNIEEAAAGIYAALHKLDNEALDIIIAQELPYHGIGAAINDKLYRASQI